MKKKSKLIDSFASHYDIKLPKPTIEDAQASIWKLYDELHLVRKELTSVVAERELIWQKIKDLNADRDSLKLLIDTNIRATSFNKIREVLSTILYRNYYLLTRAAILIGILSVGILIGKSL